MESLVRDCDKLLKHQVASTQKAVNSVDMLLRTVQELKQSNTLNDGKVDFYNLQNQVDKMHTQVIDQIKDMYTNVAKYGKHVDKAFKLDLSLVSESKAFEDKREVLAQSILLHFLREGDFEMASSFAAEAHLELPQETRAQFEDMYRMVAEIRSPAHDLSSAIAWAVQNREVLEGLSIQLEFPLHRLRFLQLIEHGQVGDALAYSRAWFPRFARLHTAKALPPQPESGDGGSWASGSQTDANPYRLECSPESNNTTESSAGVAKENADPTAASGDSKEAPETHRPSAVIISQLTEIQHLMGIFIYTKRLQTSPYAELFSEGRWEDGARLFASAFCTLLGLASTSPLSVTVGAGARALPAVCKVSTLLREKRIEWSQQNELPVEVPLPDDMRFHSVFACPVSKEQATLANPPMMMPCGHVVCKVSLDKLARGIRPGGIPSGRFKCPYCPGMSSFSDAKRVYF